MSTSLALMPYRISRCVQASFSQSHPKFGSTRGIQCTCMALFSICFSKFKKVNLWTVSDLDYILEKGDLLYKAQETERFLSCEELPTTVDLEVTALDIQFELNTLGMFLPYETKEYNVSLFENALSNVNFDYDGIIFITSGLSTTIFRDSSSNNYFVFDSHNRGYRGQVLADGTAILLSFENIRQLALYVFDRYHNLLHEIQFDIQFVRIPTILADHVIDQFLASAKPERAEIDFEDFSATVKPSRKRKHSGQTFDKKQTECSNNRTSLSHEHDSVQNFINAINNGPYFICVTCNRLMYRKTVKVFKSEKYDETLLSLSCEHVLSYDNKLYICLTCDKKLSKGKIPCQAVYNSLQVDDIPHVLKSLNRLETILISQRLLFKKLGIMSKGQMPKVKGAIVNIPVTINETCSVLPRSEDQGVFLVKLKKKMSFTGHVYFEPVCPQKVFKALEYLKLNNPLYKDIVITMKNLPDNLINLTDENISNALDQISITEEIPIEIEEDDDNCLENINHGDDAMQEHRIGASDTFLVPPAMTSEYLEIAPGENKVPKSIIDDTLCEELAFPSLFSSGQFGYKHVRQIFLSPSKYFNQRLLNYKQTFSSNSDYIFFAQFVLQQLNLNSQIRIAMRKSSSNITASMLQSENFTNTVTSLVSECRGYTFMNQIKGSPAYWKKFQLEVLSMIRQLGCPNFFLTLSCADLRWLDLFSVISKVNKCPLTEEEIKKLNYFQKCEMLNKNPVTVARHFQYRVETFFKEMLLKSDIIGKVVYYAIRVEYQMRGSPHVHCFIWTSNSISLTLETIPAYTAYLDDKISACLPDQSQNEDLHKLVQTYQSHKHSKSCQKYRNKKCRYSFGRFFSSHTIIAIPIRDIVCEADRVSLLTARNVVLNKVKGYIDAYLDPSKADYNSDKSIEEILDHLQIESSTYYQALSISATDDFEIHFRRSPDSCFVNNYNSLFLSAWNANIDLQPILNYYKAASYLCAYFSKNESETSQALIQAYKEIKEQNMNAKQGMFKYASAYATSRTMSLQEAVSYSLPELWLRKCFPKTIYINTGLPSERVRLVKSRQEIQELDPESSDIFKRNIFDRYLDRPNMNFMNGRFAVVDGLCLAMFVAYYSPEPMSDPLSDIQPVVIDNDLNVVNHNETSGLNLPSRLPLMNSKESLKCRKSKCVLRYHIPNENLSPEEYAHHVLFLFYPFRSEDSLMHEGSYCLKLSNNNVLDVVNRNRLLFEPHSNCINEALFQVQNSIIDEEVGDTVNTSEQIEEPLVVDQVQQPVLNEHTQPILPMSDHDLSDRIVSLNPQQRNVFDYIYGWSNDTVKSRNCVEKQNVDPIFVFVSGGAGVGKSYLINTIFEATVKKFQLYANSPEKVKVLKICPTGIAAINIDGTTINTGLGIPINSPLVLPKLNDTLRSSLRHKFSELAFVIIDEISMVSNIRLFHIHSRLCEIFQTSFDVPFAGISILAVGDLYQLPPVRGKYVFDMFSKELMNICHPWHHFNFFELTEVMRQQNDLRFIELLNNVRKGKVIKNDIMLLSLRNASDLSIPADALFVYAENSLKDEKNTEKLFALPHPLVEIHADDKNPENVPASRISQVSERSQSQTCGLAKTLLLKTNARVMLTNNLNIGDRLINGQMGTVMNFKYNRFGKLETIYVKFDDDRAGCSLMQSDNYALREGCVPIKKIEANIPISLSSLNPVIIRTQFPLTLAWASTIHKVQGLTLPNIVVSFTLRKQRQFNYGQIYVALSRVRSLSNLFIIGSIGENSISADPRVTAEYVRLKAKHVNMESLEIHDNKVTILNIRSLNAHKKDLFADKRLKSSACILLTETQLVNNDQHETIQQLFDEHILIMHNNADKYKSLAILIKPQYLLNNIKYFDGALYFETSLNSCIVSILLIYRSSRVNIDTFTEDILNLVFIHKPLIICGDFNINALDENRPQIVSRLQNIQYDMVVKLPTHLQGGLIDHLYVSERFQDDFNMCVDNLAVYYSDHDAVVLQCAKK